VGRELERKILSNSFLAFAVIRGSSYMLGETRRKVRFIPISSGEDLQKGRR